jgi:hypothetical protein
MNLLSLVGPWLDNICQIRRKWYYSSGWNFLQSKQGLRRTQATYTGSDRRISYVQWGREDLYYLAPKCLWQGLQADERVGVPRSQDESGVRVWLCRSPRKIQESRVFVCCPPLEQSLYAPFIVLRRCRVTRCCTWCDPSWRKSLEASGGPCLVGTWFTP